MSDTGDAGEFSACCALLYTMDLIRNSGEYDCVTNNMSRPVPVLTLLSKIAEPYRKPRKTNDLQDFTVNFTCFARLDNIACLTDKFLKALYDRCCAPILPANFAAKDILIVMKRSTSTGDVYAPMYVQVKTWKAKITKGVAEPLLLSMCTHPEFGAFKGQPFVCIVMAVGDGLSDYICEYNVVEIKDSEGKTIVFEQSALFMLVNLKNNFGLLINSLKDEIKNLCASCVDTGEVNVRLRYGSLGMLVNNCQRVEIKPPSNKKQGKTKTSKQK